MAGQVTLRILVGGDHDSRKLTLDAGIPETVDELYTKIKTIFGLDKPFRLQYQDKDFGNEYMNLLSTCEIQDRSTLKIMYLPIEATTSAVHMTLPITLGSCSTPMNPADMMSTLASSQDEDAVSFDSSDSTILMSSSTVSSEISSPETRLCSWPEVFVVPRFTCAAELQLEKANDEFKKNGILLSPSPKLRSDILEGMAEELIKYTAYPKNNQLEEAAKALTEAHPCLRERGSQTGSDGWKLYLKVKMANLRSILGRHGHPEVTVNSLKNKRQGQGKPAANIKKPRKAEVNFLPCYPKGETRESLEKQRVALLTEVKKRNNGAVIREKMQLTFSYRRQEVVQDMPMVAEIRNRWPALFQVDEVNAEFMRINVIPLESRFISQLDKYTDNLMKVFRKKGGVSGNKIRHIMTFSNKSDDINLKRDCILKCLFVYLNEDGKDLVKEYSSVDVEKIELEFPQTTMGIYVIRKEHAETEEKPEDVGVLIEGMEVLAGLRSITHACVMLFGLIYALNMSYPQDWKCTFEVFQKILMNLDGKKLSPKAQSLKIKMLQ